MQLEDSLIDKSNDYFVICKYDKDQKRDKNLGHLVRECLRLGQLLTSLLMYFAICGHMNSLYSESS